MRISSKTNSYLEEGILSLSFSVQADSDWSQRCHLHVGFP